MRSPFIARATVEAALQAKDAAHSATLSLYERMLRERDERIAVLESLLVARAPQAPAVVAPIPVTPAEPDELKALIIERSGTDYRLRSMMLRQLAADRAAGRPPDQIRAEILNGVPTDGLPA